MKFITSSYTIWIWLNHEEHDKCSVYSVSLHSVRSGICNVASVPYFRSYTFFGKDWKNTLLFVDRHKTSSDISLDTAQFRDLDQPTDMENNNFLGR
jgi:hypothetical protein